MMFQSENFSFNGVTNAQMGELLGCNLILVRSESSGLISSAFGGGRSLISDKQYKNPRTSLIDIEEAPLSFSLEFFIDDEWTIERREIFAGFMFHNDYKIFISDDNADIVYNCIAVGDSQKSFTGNNEGVVKIDFQCDSPYAWSNYVISTFDLSGNTTTTNISLTNSSKLNYFYIYPEVEFSLLSTSTGITILNNTNGINFSFSNLSLLETVYVNNLEKRIITDNATYPYRLEKFNKNWLCLNSGVNSLTVTGKCNLTFRYRNAIIV